MFSLKFRCILNVRSGSCEVSLIVVAVPCYFRFVTSRPLVSLLSHIMRLLHLLFIAVVSAHVQKLQNLHITPWGNVFYVQ